MTETIEYCTTILGKDFKSIDATKYKEMCENFDCYEHFVGDKPVKLVLDIDYGRPVNNSENIEYDEDLTDELVDEAKKIVQECIGKGVLLQFYVATSNSPSFPKWEHSKPLDKREIYWKNSARIIVTNCLATRDQQKIIIGKFNTYAEQFPWRDFCNYSKKEKVKFFDDSIYTENRKIRSSYASKPDEQRIMKIIEGTFEDGVISAFFPAGAIISKEEVPPALKSKPTNKPMTDVKKLKTDDIKEKNDTINHKWVQIALDSNILAPLIMDYKSGWLNMMYVIHDLTGNIEFAKQFSTNELKDRSHEYEATWQSITVDSRGQDKKHSLKDFENILKKLDQKGYDDIFQQIHADVQFAKTDDEASNILFERVKDLLISYEGRFVWIDDSVKIDDYILVIILCSKIYQSTVKEDLISYCQNVPKAKQVREALYAKIRTQNDKPDLYEKFHSTTKNRLCFQDGMLDFKAKTFTLWEQIPAEFEYYSCVQIPRTFQQYFHNPNHDIIAQVKDQIYANLYGDDVEKALHYLSRAITGNNQDKNFATYLGNRNCGKGVQADNLTTGCGNYVSSFELGNVLYNRKTAGMENVDCSKKLYWIMDLEFVRLAISQEIPDPTCELKVNGKIWKKLNGGGDVFQARRNYDRKDTYLQIDTTFEVMGNNSLEFDSADCMEHAIEFQSVNQFKTAEEIAARKTFLETKLSADIEAEIFKSDQEQHDARERIATELSRYKIKDETIKDKAKSLEWANAVVYLLYQSWQDKAVTIVKNYEDEDSASIIQRIEQFYEITKNIDDCEIFADVCKLIGESDKKKVEKEMKSINVFKKKVKKGKNKDKLCFLGIKLRNIVEEVEQ